MMGQANFFSYSYSHMHKYTIEHMKSLCAFALYQTHTIILEDSMPCNGNCASEKSRL